MGKRKTGRGSPSVDDVISGRERLDVVEFMRLIHRVNPTGDELSPAEAARRYRDKASLQSVLLRLHGASLVVVETGEGVVSIRHAHFDIDACHAVLDDLDEDARSLARWRLDVGPDGAPAVLPAPRERSSSRTDDLSARGRRALEEYDYEEARACFEAAWRADCGALDLLELLVDHLADYEAALSLQLGVRDDAVRPLLARAAVRLGRRDEGETHLRGLSPSLAADTLAELTELHLSAGDAAAAKRAVDRLGDAVPRHSAHADLERRTEALASAGRREGERDAEEALRAGDEERAEELCRGLLAAHGASAVARRVLADVEARRGRRQAEVFRGEALRAQAQGDAEEALRLLLRAKALAPGDDALRALADEAAQRCADVRRAEERKRAAKTLADGDLRSGLLAWAALTAADRALVPLAATLHERAEHALARRPPREAVDAVLALEEALTTTDPRQAARIVATHRDALEGLPALARIHAAAAREEQRLATERGLAALEAAEGALRRLDEDPDALPQPDRLQSAEAQLREAARSLPSPESRARLDAAVARHERATRVVALEQRARHLSAQGRDVEARDALDGALQLLPAPGRTARRQALADGIHATWHLRWDPPDQVDLVDVDGLGAGHESGDWLTEDLRHTLFLAVHGPWLFVRVVAVEGVAVTRALRLRMPSDTDFPTLRLQGRTLSLAGRSFVLDVDLDGGEITRHVDVTAVVGEDVQCDDILLPDARHLVLTPGLGRTLSPARFVDLSRRRVEGTVGGFDFASLLTTPASTRVAMSNFNHEIMLVDLRGRPAPGRIVCPCEVVEVLPSPRGDGLLLVESGDEGVALFEIDEDGTERGALPIPDSDEYFGGASAHDPALTALLLRGDVQRELVVVEATGPAPTIVWRAEVPKGTTLSSPPSRRHVVATVYGPDGPVFLPIGRTPPTVIPGPAERFELPMLYRGLLNCAVPGGDRGDAVYDRLDEPDQSSTAMLEAELNGLLDDGRVSEALDRETVGMLAGASDWARAMRQRIAERYPGHPETKLLAAQTAVDERKGDEAVALLSGDLPAEAHADVRRHVLHVRGLGRFQAGDLGGARRDWLDAQSHPGTCPVEDLVQALGPDGEAASDEEPAGPRTRLHLGDLRALVGAADRLHADGDLDGARAALHRRAVWHLHEEQTMARLAAVHLDLHAATGRHSFATALACARLVGHPSVFRHPKSLPMEQAWDEARLQAVRDRATAWLADSPT